MFYRIILFIFKPLVWLIYRTKITGKEHLKEVKDTGYILIADHSSYSDPVILAISIGQRILRFMAKAELFRGAFGWLIKALGAFPIHRDKLDSKSIKTAMETVKKGHVCLIFPEGKRNKEYELLPFEKGVAFITLQCKVPVLPAYIGKKRKNGRTLVNFGQPINVVELSKQFEKADRLEKITEHLRERVLVLQAEQEEQWK